MASMLKFNSRRSPIVCTKGCVASSQPLATAIGLDILKKGGNAADAAVAVAAALNVTEPTSTGIGGDCFCLFYRAENKKVYGLNGSGRAPRSLSLQLLKQQGFDEENPPPILHAHNITVPGAAAGWVDTVDLFGSKKLSLAEILQPAIELAESGFPVSEICALQWKSAAYQLQAPNNKFGKELLINGQAPQHGQVFKNPSLAKTFKTLAESGKKGFYEGRIAQAIVQLVQSNGGVLDLCDLSSHDTEQVEPINTTFKGLKVWEMPPNGQGITALMAFNMLENFNVKELGHNSADYLHLISEVLKLAATDCQWYCADPSVVPVPTEDLISKTYAVRRAKLINMQRASENNKHGNPFDTGSDTVYFSVVDEHGNACSFINSNYMDFGTGLVPEGCGFTLHVLLNMAVFEMNPQLAVDAPRLYIEYDQKDQKWHLYLEEGIASDVVEMLKARGHVVHWPISGYGRKQFGRGQIISNGEWWNKSHAPVNSSRVWWAGSDPRADGCAMGYSKDLISGTKMCFGKCAKCIGYLLLVLAIMCIVANLLLYFPNGETRWAREDRLTNYVWFFIGIGGAGLLMLIPAFVFISLEGEDCGGCCGHRKCGRSCAMLGSVVAALIGMAGSAYCIIISALALAKGPYCNTSTGWRYPFENSDAHYLSDHSTWSECTEPARVVTWNVTLFSILLGLSGIEFILCVIQVINGIIGGICGACCCQQKTQSYQC
ncbi:transmembrane 4 L6 family member 1 [Gastrophryne carolinensis]